FVAEIVSPTNFFAEQFFFNNGGVAYMGVLEQTTGFTSRIARFSVWDATAANGPGCTPFGGEGVGWTCTIPFWFAEGRGATVRMGRTDTDSVGQWWDAYIIDSVTGAELWIGSIRAPAGNNLITSTVNFDEYWGEAVPCNAVPRSKVWFLPPSVNAKAGYGSV